MSMIVDGTNGLTFNNNTTQASASKILQVQSVAYGTAFSSTTNTGVAMSGLQVNITSTLANSKFLLLFSGNGTNGPTGGGDGIIGFTFARSTNGGSSYTRIGNTGTATYPKYFKTRLSFNDSTTSLDNYFVQNLTGNYLDSPSFAAGTALTYNIIYDFYNNGTHNTIYINDTISSTQNSPATYDGGSVTTLTVLEVAP